MELKELYQEIILDHGKNPRNKGACKNYSHEAKGHNPLCGDKVHIFAKIDKDKNILIGYNPKNETSRDILRKVEESGLNVKDFSVSGASLETVFLSITSKK